MSEYDCDRNGYICRLLTFGRFPDGDDKCEGKCTCEGCEDVQNWMEYAKEFLRILMQSERVSSSTELAETFKVLIVNLLENSITITGFLGKLRNGFSKFESKSESKIELVCQNFSPLVQKSLEISLPNIRDEINRGRRFNDTITISDMGEIMVSQGWTAEQNRYKAQEEIAKVIEEINVFLGHVEPKVAVETVAFEWEDKIFDQSQENELKYKAEIVRLLSKLRGNAIQYSLYYMIECKIYYISSDYETFVKSMPTEDRYTTNLFADIEAYSRTQHNDDNCSICLISV